MKKTFRNRLRILRILLSALGMAIVLLGFSGLLPSTARLLRLQFGPAALRALEALAARPAAAALAGALGTVLALLLLTWIAGRFYCVCLCPLGIWQDFIAWIARRKTARNNNLPWLRYLLAGFAWSAALFGWSIAFLALDPYSNFGRMLRPFSLGAAVSLAGILLLTLWKKRFFCTNLCPVGTLLGLVSKGGLFRLQIVGKCVQCGKCAARCPADCIDPATGTLDNERCVRCLNCLSDCPLGSVRFQPLWKSAVHIPYIHNEQKGPGEGTDAPSAAGTAEELSRRRFLLHGGILLAGAFAGLALARTGLQSVVQKARRLPAILPPGAGDAARFARKCTACQLCVQNCPQHIIRPAPGGYGPVRLELTNGFCDFDCHRCGDVCPTGAILPLGLDAKRKTKIAVASFHAQNCLVFQEGTPCGRCQAACPAGAISLRKSGAPRPVKTDLCIGCGKCQFVCPASPKAMTVAPLQETSHEYSVEE